ncbi:MAG TPA: hypothetical protein VM262_06005 [Acidimicrobiales bacterium]|nr:hypothetical protein [Acidimicrobiales bacterium]
MNRSRRAAAVVALALLAAACGRGDDPTVPAPGATPDGAAPAAPSDTGAGDPGPGTASTTTPLGGGPPFGDTTTLPGPAPDPAPDTSGPPGSAAAYFLRSQPATSLVVEVSAEAGAEPRAATMEHVRSTLAAVSGKQVSVVAGSSVAPREQWSAADIRAAADAAAVTRQGATGVLRLVFVRGGYADSDTALGVAVRADVAAIFVDRVARSASPLVGAGAIETAVTTHEVGHLLGLVDLYLDTGRADPEHPGHSSNRRSVMYWAVESTLVADLLTGGPPRDFDEDDLADLAAIRG